MRKKLKNIDSSIYIVQDGDLNKWIRPSMMIMMMIYPGKIEKDVLGLFKRAVF